MKHFVHLLLLALLAGEGLLMSHTLPGWSHTVSLAPLQASGDTHPVAILFEKSLPFIECRVNGETMLALVDTGSFRSIQISSTLAQKIGVMLSDTPRQSNRYGGSAKAIKTGTVASFGVGGIEARAQQVDVIDADIESIAQQVGVPFSAILGWGFLGTRAFVLDYGAHTIDFQPVTVADERGGIPLRYETVSNVPIVTGIVNGSPVKWLFDTGAPICNVDPWVSPDPHVQATFDSATLDVQCRSKDLSALKRPTGALAVTGNNVLLPYVVRLNPTSRTIVLTLREVR